VAFWWAEMREKVAFEWKRDKPLGFSDLRKEEFGPAAKSILTRAPPLFNLCNPPFCVV